MVDGCRQSGMALIGGETAEMPGVYQDGEYDLAGFSVGDLTPSEMFTETRMSEGDMLIGLASSGFHSNGYSLLRKLVKDDETELMKELLVPTKIYVDVITKLHKKHPNALLGMAHMTGGGIDNIPRMSENFDYQIPNWPDQDEIAPVFKKILSRVDLPREELFRTFNMGVGMTLMVKKAQASEVLGTLRELQVKAWELGSIKKGTGQVSLI
ncbi:Phosphoribosylformylglycinamidine cyclo-ligase [compost metagenome]